MDAAQPNPQEQRATDRLARLCAAHAECTVEADPPRWLFGTNHITFGTCAGEPVVYKHFDWTPRKLHEQRALDLFAPTGLVPRVLPVADEHILVMQRLPGVPLDVAEREGPLADVPGLYRQLGAALARIVQAAPGASIPGRRAPPADAGFDYAFYGNADLDVLFEAVTGAAARALATRPVPHARVLAESLNALVARRTDLLAYPAFVQMDDIHTHNIMADGRRLSGFIDLEMTRRGNEPLLLAAAVEMTARDPPLWRMLRAGYEDQRGAALSDKLLALARAAAPFSQWIRFMWYWGTDALPGWAVEANLRGSTARYLADLIAALA